MEDPVVMMEEENDGEGVDDNGNSNGVIETHHHAGDNNRTTSLLEASLQSSSMSVIEDTQQSFIDNSVAAANNNNNNMRHQHHSPSHDDVNNNNNNEDEDLLMNQHHHYHHHHEIEGGEDRGARTAGIQQEAEEEEEDVELIVSSDADEVIEMRANHNVVNHLNHDAHHTTIQLPLQQQQQHRQQTFSHHNHLHHTHLDGHHHTMESMYLSPSESKKRQRHHHQRTSTPHSSRSTHQQRKRHDHSSRKSSPPLENHPSSSSSMLSSLYTQLPTNNTNSRWLSTSSLSVFDLHTTNLSQSSHRVYSNEPHSTSTMMMKSSGTTSSSSINKPSFELRMPSGHNDLRFCDSASALYHSNGCVYFAHGPTIYELPLHQRYSIAGDPQGVRRIVELPLSKLSSGGKQFIWVNQIVASPAAQSLYVVSVCKSKQQEESQHKSSMINVFRVGLDGTVIEIQIPDECRQSTSQLPSSICSLSVSDSGHLIISSNDVWCAGMKPTLWLSDTSGQYQWIQINALKTATPTLTIQESNNNTHDNNNNRMNNNNNNESGWMMGGNTSSSSSQQMLGNQQSSSSSQAVEHLGDQYSTIVPMKEGLIELHDTFVDGTLLLLTLRTSLNRTKSGHPCLLRAQVVIDPSTSAPTLKCVPVFTSEDFSQLPERDWQKFRVDPTTMGSIYASYVVETNDLTTTGLSPINNDISSSSSLSFDQAAMSSKASSDNKRPLHTVARLPLSNYYHNRNNNTTSKVLSEGCRDHFITNISGFWCLGFGKLMSGKCEAASSLLASPSKKEKRRLIINCNALPDVPIRENFEFPEVMLQDTTGDVRLECYPLEAFINQTELFIESSLHAHFAVLRWRSKELLTLMMKKRDELNHVHSTSTSPSINASLHSLIRLQFPCTKQTLAIFRQYLYTQSLTPLMEEYIHNNNNHRHDTTHNNQYHINIAELFILGIRFNLNCLVKRMEDLLLRQLNPDTVLDTYEILQFGLKFLDLERVPVEEIAKLCFVRKAATSMIIQYLSVFPLKRISHLFDHIHKGSALREMLYERYENRLDVRQHWRDVILHPSSSQRVVSELCQQLKQSRINQNKEEFDSLAIVH